MRPSREEPVKRLLQGVAVAALTVAVMFSLSYAAGRCVDVPAWQERDYGFTFHCTGGALSLHSTGGALRMVAETGLPAAGLGCTGHQPSGRNAILRTECDHMRWCLQRSSPAGRPGARLHWTPPRPASRGCACRAVQRSGHTVPGQPGRHDQAPVQPGRAHARAEVCQGDNCYFTLRSLAILSPVYLLLMAAAASLAIPGGLFMPSIMARPPLWAASVASAWRAGTLGCQPLQRLQPSELVTAAGTCRSPTAPP